MTFEIERHPGLHHYLLHTVQRWTVDLKSAQAHMEERWTPLTLEDLKNVEFARGAVDVDSIIGHALAYEARYIKEGNDDYVGAFALAYCYLLAQCSKRFRGGLKAIHRFARSFDAEVLRQLPELQITYAAAVRDLWATYKSSSL